MCLKCYEKFQLGHFVILCSCQYEEEIPSKSIGPCGIAPWSDVMKNMIFLYLYQKMYKKIIKLRKCGLIRSHFLGIQQK